MGGPECDSDSLLDDSCLSNYRTLTAEEIASNKFSSLKRAAHGMLLARKSKLLLGLYDMKALMMMHMRLDGRIGFPGGVLDDGETPVEGLNREMKEEISLDLKKYSFEETDLVNVQINEKKGMLNYFYLKEVEYDDFIALERNMMKAEHFGVEIMGNIRVPLSTMTDGQKGFPAFLSNHFAGNAKYNLLQGLLASGLMSEEEIHLALTASK